MAYLEIFFIPRSLRTTRNNRSSPHNGSIKKFFPKILLRIRIRIRIFIYPQPLRYKKLYILIYVVKNAPLIVGMICYISALERTFAKKLTYGEMQVEERIARIGSGDPGSHLGIPVISQPELHANKYKYKYK